jgi:hypothetical protein
LVLLLILSAVAPMKKRLSCWLAIAFLGLLFTPADGISDEASEIDLLILHLGSPRYKERDTRQ